ncbi:uncharacterized protein PAC_15907 [Phialocephala subalpina]|uniref:2EXR domain-containing protein n=1 Tax=Phialocephala subalpina TaxID=576137 RepID=A0A1L7XM38_9HELO|nr:uncharacterized protein PAC_15907 [Phialocephala subalpina]
MPPLTRTQAKLLPSATHALTSFTCFLDLPLELRVKIWKYACFVTRDVYLGLKNRTGNISATGGIPDNTIGLDVYRCFVPRTPIPAVLHRDGYTFSTPPRIYIKWAVDRLCLGRGAWCQRSVTDLATRFVQNKLRFLVVHDKNDQIGTLLRPLLEADCLQTLDTIGDDRPYLPTGEYPPITPHLEAADWARRDGSSRYYQQPVGGGPGRCVSPPHPMTLFLEELKFRLPEITLRHDLWFWTNLRKVLPYRDDKGELVVGMRRRWHNDPMASSLPPYKLDFAPEPSKSDPGL